MISNANIVVIFLVCCERHKQTHDNRERLCCHWLRLSSCTQTTLTTLFIWLGPNFFLLIGKLLDIFPAHAFCKLLYYVLQITLFHWYSVTQFLL